MEIDIKHIAKLARLRIEDDEDGRSAGKDALGTGNGRKSA